MNAGTNIMKLYFSNTFLSKRFFAAWFLVVAVFVLSFSYTFLYALAVLLFLLLLSLSLADLLLVKSFEGKLECQRILPKVLALGEEIAITLDIQNLHSLFAGMEVIDELPAPFQKRDLSFRISLSSGQEKQLRYTIRPLSRGLYTFGNCNIFVSTLLGLVQHRMVFPLQKPVPVFPSSIQVKKHELLLFNKIFAYQGVKRLRRIGHSYEFEQIKNYTSGDDVRSINWKATGRRSQLMVNQFGDEKSQQVYLVLDKSRAMNMPFDGLSLLDHAVNSALVLSNTVMHKDDKAGLLTFNEKIGSFVKAERKPGQLKLLSETLYKESESDLEANYELLYRAISRLIKQRSLILLYTNFESYYTMERYLPLLRKISRSHLLLVIVFKNTEIERYSYGKATDTLDIYQRTIGKKFMYEKEMMVRELARYGIPSVLSTPEELSTQTINKYLEFKAKGWI